MLQKTPASNDSKSVWEQSHEGSNPSRCATKKDICKADVLFCGFRRRRAVPPFGIKMLVRRTRAAGQKTGWVVLLCFFEIAKYRF